MKILANLLWDIFGGLISAILWAVFGVIWCCTVVGIPFGLFCFKMAGLVLWPFGRELDYDGKISSLVLDIIWIILTGCELALVHLVFGAILCCTIVGIPFGIQHFKLAVMCMLPVGTKIH